MRLQEKKEIKLHTGIYVGRDWVTIIYVILIYNQFHDKDATFSKVYKTFVEWVQSLLKFSKI